MTHLSADLLRRYCDEPSALLSVEKEHVLACPRCRALRDEIAANAAFAAETLAVPAKPLDLEAARRAVEARAARGPASLDARRARFSWTPRVRWAGGIAAAVALAAGLSLSPVRTTAANFLAIFEPHSFQPIAVTRSDMQALQGFPELSAFGDVAETGTSTARVAHFGNVLDAMRAANQVVLHPRYLPAGIPAQAAYVVIPPKTGAFTFSAAKARNSAARNHAALPPMPANLDGSTLYASFSSAVVSLYGAHAAEASNAFGAAHRRRHHGPGSGLSGLAGVAVFQAPAPRVYSSGASVRDIIDYLVIQPGVSPSLAAQIRAIGDPSTTLPIPIPVDKALAQTVSIGGSPALVIGDETGVGSVVVWERGGMVYGVAGPLRESELLMVASSLTQ
jgi:hypothetical protein